MSGEIQPAALETQINVAQFVAGGIVCFARAFIGAHKALMHFIAELFEHNKTKSKELVIVQNGTRGHPWD